MKAKKLYDACLENAANLEQIPKRTKIFFYSLNGNNEVIHVLANYVHNSLKIRDSTIGFILLVGSINAFLFFVKREYT